MPSCEIRCEHCSEWFPSPFHYITKEAFFTSTLVNNGVSCPKCGRDTGCDKENMRFRAGDEGFLGTKV